MTSKAIGRFSEKLVIFGLLSFLFFNSNLLQSINSVNPTRIQSTILSTERFLSRDFFTRPEENWFLGQQKEEIGFAYLVFGKHLFFLFKMLLKQNQVDDYILIVVEVDFPLIFQCFASVIRPISQRFNTLKNVNSKKC